MHDNSGGAAHRFVWHGDYTMICDGCGEIICEHSSNEDFKKNPNISLVVDEEIVCGNWGHAYYQCSTCGRKQLSDHNTVHNNAAHHYVTKTVPEAYVEAYSSGTIPTKGEVENMKRCCSFGTEVGEIAGRTQALNACEYRYKDAERMVALQNISDDYIVEICERCHRINVHSLRLQRDEIERIAQANQMLTLVNNFRAENGKSALVLDDYLGKLAYARARELAELGFGHPKDIAGSTKGVFGENIAANGRNNFVEYHFEQWKGSSGHRANMLGDYKTFAYSCISYDVTPYNWKFGVQLFKISNEIDWCDGYKNKTLKDVTGLTNTDNHDIIW